MTDISKLHQMLDWKLLSGSHDFPGTEGGTCVNEAAIVAAGLKYQEITEADDLPKCFCRVIGATLIDLNDNMPDDARQMLIKYIPILPGSRDMSKGIRHQRMKEIAISVGAAYIAYIAILEAGPKHMLEYDFNHKFAYDSLDQYRNCVDKCSVTNLQECVHTIIRHGLKYCENTDIWITALSGIDRAFQIGKQATPIDISIAKLNMEAAKKQAKELYYE